MKLLRNYHTNNQPLDILQWPKILCKTWSLFKHLTAYSIVGKAMHHKKNIYAWGARRT